MSLEEQAVFILSKINVGKYDDQEVNLFYNYFRDYDPITGRYVESDPIGLDGGLNTYGYVGGNPLLKGITIRNGSLHGVYITGNAEGCQQAFEKYTVE